MHCDASRSYHPPPCGVLHPHGGCCVAAGLGVRDNLLGELMSIPRKVVAAVLARDNHRCVIAGPLCTGAGTIADHRANRGSGGSKALDIPENLISACPVCNGMKEDANGPYRAELLARGIRVQKRATNAQTAGRCASVPVLYSDGWHYLEGVVRVPTNAHTAVEYMVLIGAIRDRWAE